MKVCIKYILIVVTSIMKYLFLLFTPLVLACNGPSAENTHDIQNEIIDELINDQNEPMCPENHTDSIIPIIYGLPTAEAFARADSGLVVLGGCELQDYTYYCKIHAVNF